MKLLFTELSVLSIIDKGRLPIMCTIHTRYLSSTMVRVYFHGRYKDFSITVRTNGAKKLASSYRNVDFTSYFRYLTS